VTSSGNASVPGTLTATGTITGGMEHRFPAQRASRPPALQAPGWRFRRFGEHDQARHVRVDLGTEHGGGHGAIRNGDEQCADESLGD